MLVHLRCHTNEKNYHCQYCESSFCDSSTLKKHLRTHTGEKPYACHLCPKSFAQSGNLKRHIEVHKKYEALAASQAQTVQAEKNYEYNQLSNLKYENYFQNNY